MKIHFISSAILSVVLATSGAYAANWPRPQVCPEAAAISAVGVSENAIQLDDVWVTGRRNQEYGTENHWTFIVGNIPASCASEAFEKADNAVRKLDFQVGPIEGPFGRWICLYHAKKYPAVAVFPPLAAMSQAKQFLTQK